MKVSDSTIIAAYFFPFSLADLACMLRVSRWRIVRTWARAKARGDLPKARRPALGDLRRMAMRLAS